jgi:hypothetical protein
VAARYSADMAISAESLVAEAAPRIGATGGAFYFVPETVAAGERVGLDAGRFYFLGRGGVLGDVDWRVVHSAFGYFNPSFIEHMWESGRKVVAPSEAGRLHLECCREFGRARLADLEGLEGFCEAAAAVVQAADPAGLTLFAGIASHPLPDDLPARAMQLVAVLRELRGSAHLVAVLASGLEPRVAHYIKRPDFFELFGWSAEDRPEVGEEDRRRLEEAEALTDRLVLRAFGAIEESRREQFLSVLEAIQAKAGA